MLVLQIAAGIILAVLLIRFWRQAIVSALALALLGGLVALWFWGSDQGPDVLRLIGGVIWGAIAIYWIVGRVQAKSEQAVIVADDPDSRGEDPPVSHPS